MWLKFTVLSVYAQSYVAMYLSPKHLLLIEFIAWIINGEIKDC